MVIWMQASILKFKNITMRKIIFKTIAISILITALGGCSSFLDVKPDEKLTVPNTLLDFLAILNGTEINLGPSEGEIMAGDYYVSDDDFQALFCESDIDTYSWKDSPFIQKCDGDDGWTQNYTNIYRANVALEGLDEFESSKGISEQSSTTRGHALFMRAINHFELAVIWGEPYDPTDAENKLGIPLKTIADFNEKSVRSSLASTFAQILEDLEMAAELLPMQRQTNRWPGKYAAWGYLARVYLYMQDFEKARFYAEQCLAKGHHALIDFNTIDVAANYPFNLNSNTEFFVARNLTTAYYSLNINVRKIDSDLYNSYIEDDLRKLAFFRINTDGSIRFKGGQSGSGSLFSGTTLGEMYLISAETHARNGNYSESRKYLNDLLKKRMKSDYVLPEIADEELLDDILLERRKELVMRGIRFGDIKRLNVLGANIGLKRIIMGEEYILPPNDLRFSLLIPESVIRISGMVQNKR